MSISYPAMLLVKGATVLAAPIIRTI